VPEPKLKWIPLPLDGSIAAPPDLEDFQVGWFWNLFWTALRNPEHPGFLASRKNLWTFAGAHRRAHWDANCALVMAAFELREIAGQKLWCLPTLVEIVERQQKKLRDHKGGVFREIHRDPQASGDSSPSQSVFDFDRKDQKEKTRADLSSKKPAAGEAPCALHPDSGLTNWGSCWACYAAKYG
jgi:hypothetical protein